jgi:hypothetical protein
MMEREEELAINIFTCAYVRLTNLASGLNHSIFTKRVCGGENAVAIHTAHVVSFL